MIDIVGGAANPTVVFDTSGVDLASVATGNITFNGLSRVSQTTGAQTFNGAVAVSQDRAFVNQNGADITFTSTLDEGGATSNLGFDTAGNVHFDGNVGAILALESIRFDDSFQTVNNVTFGGTVHTVGNLTQDAGSGTTTFNGVHVAGLDLTTANVVSASGPLDFAGTAPISAAVSLDAASTLQVNLDGTTAGTDFDQLVVTGTVAPGGATLAVDKLASFDPSAGDAFIIIDNDGTDAVNGTFANSEFVLDGTKFRVIYDGGDGNDVVLTVVVPLTLVVDTITDDGTKTDCTPAANDCSLRGAIAVANADAGDDVSTFDPTVFSTPQTITLSNGQLAIDNNGTLTINGTGADQLTISGNDASGVLEINSGATAEMNDVTISDGDSGGGGGIFNNGGTLTLNNTTVSGNSGMVGGGILNSSGTTTLNNSIIANSTSGGDCGRSGGTINASYSLIEQHLNCVNGTNSNNLTGDPNLGSLADNGGSTFTHALLLGSIAIDAGDTPTCLATDQRGIARPQGSGCDIGVFESLGFTLVNVSGSPQSTMVNTDFPEPYVVRLASNDPGLEPGPGVVLTLTAPGSGASLSPNVLTATTDLSSTASFALTANATVGGYTATVTVSNQVQPVSGQFSNTGQPPLNVAKAGNGAGSVTSTPSGIDCGATCSAVLDYGTQPGSYYLDRVNQWRNLLRGVRLWHGCHAHGHVHAQRLHGVLAAGSALAHHPAL